MEQSQNDLFTALKKLNVDVDKTISRFMDNSELYITFLKRFPDEDRISPIKDAISNNNLDALLQTSHKLKGVTANLGMRDLSEAAAAIVRKARAGSLDGVDRDIELVEKLNGEICRAIKENI